MGDENATNSQKNNPNILSASSLSDAMKYKIMIAIFVFCTIFVSSHALHLANLEIKQCCTLEHEINNHCLRKCRRMRFPIIPGRAKPGGGKFVFLPPSQIAPICNSNSLRNPYIFHIYSGRAVVNRDLLKTLTKSPKYGKGQ